MWSDVLAIRGDLEVDLQVMSEELDDGTEPDCGLMEGLLFDLGIFGDHTAALGGPRSRSGVPAGRTLSAGPTTSVPYRPLPADSTGLSPSFDDDPLRELTRKCSHHVLGKSLSLLQAYIILFSISLVFSLLILRQMSLLKTIVLMVEM